MTFKIALVALVAMTTPANAEALKRMPAGYYCGNVQGMMRTWECTTYVVKSVDAGERADVLDRAAEVQKDPKKAAEIKIEARIKRIEADGNAEKYRIKFPDGKTRR